MDGSVGRSMDRWKRERKKEVEKRRQRKRENEREREKERKRDKETEARIRTSTTCRFVSRFALPSVCQNNSPLQYVSNN